MNPTEVAGLQSLAMAQGGSLTINPDTGLPEAFSLGGFFKGLLPMFVGAATGGAGMPLMTGIIAGAATGALTNKNRLMGALTGGLGGYSGFGIGKSLLSAGAPNIGAQAAGGGSSGLVTGGGYIPNATSAADIAYNSAMMGPTAGAVNTGLGNVGSSMMTDPSILNARNAAQTLNTAGGGTGSALANSAASPTEQALSNYGSNLSQSLKGAGNIFSGDQAAIDAYTKGMGAKTAMGALGKTALPVAGAALSGLEESDIYGKPINMAAAKEEEKYDPYRTLNLSGSTGLRLVAKGGYIDGYAEGGVIQPTITTGGIRDLYGSSDNQTQALSSDGFGLGRLSNLANQQAMTTAKTLGYAMGGPISFADGGDSNKEDAMGLPSLSPDTNIVDAGQIGLGQGFNPAMLQSVMGAMQPMQGMQGSTTNQGQIPDQNNDSLIAKVTANLKSDPNYQPTNPIEAAIVKQIKGGDTIQQGQGITSLAAKPSQPMAPSYNPTPAITPTYYAGINAPRGYAEGGETSLNLDRLPSLNVNTGESNYMTPDGGGMYAGRLMKDAYRQNPDNPMFRLLSRMPDNMVFNRQMAKGGYLDGQGDGMSDSIPATIEGKQPARLADGEFVVPADVVSHIGNGSSKAGSKKLYAMMDKVRRARTGHTKQGKQINADKYLPKVA
jgi:hypothetical protein